MTLWRAIATPYRPQFLFLKFHHLFACVLAHGVTHYASPTFPSIQDQVGACHQLFIRASNMMKKYMVNSFTGLKEFLFLEQF